MDDLDEIPQKPPEINIADTKSAVAYLEDWLEATYKPDTAFKYPPWLTSE